MTLTTDEGLVPDDLLHELQRTDVRDELAVRLLARRVDALATPEDIRNLCSASRALRSAVGRLRADALSALLARNEREEFVRRAGDAEFMTPVAIEDVKVPRFLALGSYECSCGCALLIPYDRQGGPALNVECPSCASPYIAKPAYNGGGDHALRVEPDLRPAKKRKKKY